RAGFRVADILAGSLLGAGETSALFKEGAGIHPRRWTRKHAAHTLAKPATAPANMGLRGRQISHRPHLVVLPVLAARVSAEEFWADGSAARGADYGALHHFGRGERRRRVALFFAAQARRPTQHRQ